MPRFFTIGFLLTLCPLTQAAEKACDIVIYGGSSAGVVAALQAARMGKSAIVVEPGRHLGGLTTGGLGATDIGNKAAIGGISRDFYRRLGRHYGEAETWKFEPHVAQEVMSQLARESKAEILLEHRLAEVKKSGTRIESITVAPRPGAGAAISVTIRGRMFIDATYEGDLMAKAGVSYTVGREAVAKYDESLNGIQFGQKHHQFDVPVDPYRTPGDPASGLLPRISADDPGRHGEGDHRVQAYCFRMCLTQRPDIRIPFARPEGYDRDQYALLARYLQNAEKAGIKVPIMHNVMMPNGKTDTNNHGGFSTDNIGRNYAYPDADWDQREKIIREHEVYQKGFMYFLANDEAVPERVRKEVSSWGLCSDEFTDNGGWPHQLYIREARRMVGGHVMTQHHCQHRESVDDAVGLAAYQMDSHNCQRFARDGKVLNEGDVQVGAAAPYVISYRSIVPKASECTNLAVPICMSASHIAYGSIRMEPVFMILGESSATAASLAIDAGGPLQELPYAKLRERLLADGQVLAWTGAVRKPQVPVKLPGIVIDDDQAVQKGHWAASASASRFVGGSYLHDGNIDKGEKSVRFPIRVEKPGRYRLSLSVAANNNRATNVPVTIRHADGTDVVKVNQRREPPVQDHGLVALGTFRFAPGAEAYVEISNHGTNGYVVADAVQLLPAP